MDAEIHSRLIGTFRNRARRLRKTASVAIVLIILSLIIGIYIFIFSGNIALKEISGLKLELRQVEPVQPLKEGDTRSALNERLLQLQEKIDSLHNQLASTIDDSAASVGSAKTIYLISTVTTRIGSVLILLFLVQILTSLYRYNIRLAAYYDARADGLEIIGTDSGEIFENIVRALSPETIDFGKGPTSPAGHAVELAKEVLSLKGKIEKT